MLKVHVSLKNDDKTLYEHEKNIQGIKDAATKAIREHKRDLWNLLRAK